MLILISYNIRNLNGVNMSVISGIRVLDPKVRETFRAQSPRSCMATLGKIVFAPLTIAKSAFHLGRTVLQTVFQPYIYHASSAKFKQKLDCERLEKSREDLRQIGGSTVAIQTTDGDWIEAMYFDVNEFKSAMVSHGGRFIVDPSGKQYLRSYSDELTETLRKTMKLEGRFVVDPDVEDDLVFEVELTKSAPLDPEVSQRQVMILTQGNGGIFEKDRASVAATLLKGQSCMVFNVRGTGRSHGKPNEDRSYRDIEAVYQYLIHKGFTPDQMCVNGYCLGAGLAVDLASRHPVNLILDRPFARIGDVMADVARDYIVELVKLDPENPRTQMIGNFTSDAVSSVIDHFVISYNNKSKLPRVRGSILYVHSDKDEVIPVRSREKMKEALKVCPNATIQTSDAFEHCEPWDEATEQVHQDHSRRYGMARRYPNTSIPPSLALDRLSRHPIFRLTDTKFKASALVGAAAATGGVPAVVTTSVVLGAREGYKRRKALKDSQMGM